MTPAPPERSAAVATEATEALDQPATTSGTGRSLRTRLWLGFCRLIVRTFYRRIEVRGSIPARGPALLCANHQNAFADVAVLQSAAPRVLHPLARSGLFEQPLMRLLLRFLQAVPIYRAVDASDTARNVDSFVRCYELLERGGMLVLFPEGVSHSQPTLQPLKTGAARVALGCWLRGGPLPALVPAGLTWVEKGRFRSRVLLQIGAPLDLAPELRQLEQMPPEDRPVEPPADLVRSITDRLDRAIRALTLNVDSWQDLQLMRQLERFFHFRRGRHPGSVPLERRFRTFQRLIEAQTRLERHAPERLARLRRELEWFERLRRLYVIDEYQLQFRYRPSTVLHWLGRNLVLVVLSLPFFLWAALTSGIPYLLVGVSIPRVSRRYDQFDTNRILLALAAYGLFWGGEIAWVLWRFGWLPALLFTLSLPSSGAIALLLLRRREAIVRQTRAFFLFRRKRDLRPYVLERRREIEDHLADLARLARRLHDRERSAASEQGADAALDPTHDLR